ncbi:hypothetical protein [Enterovirga aerilata]|uniref:Uncharacterized protein n=1 Tax=Enterovirga aerilata TaxID=2730920 RepID=A0A849IFU9_9HYPH|nr:hypothetical protein [Enterovirga sp. DB1703]NNM75095.1 hypothetical protein [Enterovirga sp. DB1703]
MAAKKMSKTRYVSLRVVFDKPVSDRDALALVRNALNGQRFDLSIMEEEGASAGTFKVAKVIGGAL